MLKSIAKFILRLHGWRVNTDAPPEAQHCVMTAAPHTTNWDMYFMRMSLFALGIPVRFTIKSFWTKFPMGLIMKPLGALGIDRRGNAKERGAESYVEQMQGFFKKHDRIAVVVTPEGTRSPQKKWKTGFYYVAVGANVPITFGYLDYKKKEAGVGKVPLYPSGNKNADMKILVDFYRNIPPKYPEKFVLDERYA